MPEDQPDGSGAGPPQPRDLLAAFGVLTVMPVGRPDPRSGAFARATVFFPIVGSVMGTLLASAHWMMPGRVPPWLTDVVLVGVWEGLRRPDDRRVVGGWLTAAAMLAKMTGLALATGGQAGALLFAPLLASWGIVVLAVGARDADAPGRKFNSVIAFREFAVTSVFTGAVVFTVAEAAGILVFVCIGALAVALRVLAHRWSNGVTWRFLVTSAQVIETVVVLLFASL